LNARDDVARAIAFFQSSDDVAMLRKALVDVAPRARRLVFRYMGAGGEDTVPPPASVDASDTPALEAEALRTLATIGDFALLQAMTRAIGRRVEELEGPNGS
jgi:hypothetical protein